MKIYGFFFAFGILLWALIFQAQEVSPQNRDPNLGRLFIKTEPKGARIRILNIRPVFVQGIKLKNGDYHIEVSADRYQTNKQWIRINSGEDKEISVRLKKNTFRDEAVITIAKKYIDEMSSVYQKYKSVEIKHIKGKKTLYAEIIRSGELYSEHMDITGLLLLSTIAKHGHAFYQLAFDFSGSKGSDAPKLFLKISDAKLYFDKRISFEELMRRVYLDSKVKG